ncbi:hypothetical protein CDAR_247821 [Caerostris darwini]|uniref:Uncharacterized protein n=1 Tax=Caerostris darwini TaxID=1538125 RepID=A0AAV4TBC0_9ARAC|nr:hypothetical protein CDAR_247821 [Caerostris darwini]
MTLLCADVVRCVNYAIATTKVQNENKTFFARPCAIVQSHHTAHIHHIIQSFYKLRTSAAAAISDILESHHSPYSIIDEYWCKTEATLLLVHGFHRRHTVDVAGDGIHRKLESAPGMRCGAKFHRYTVTEGAYFEFKLYF